MHDAIKFAVTLDQMDGVGRVTAGRLLAHFATHADLRRYPREQVLARIKGAPNAQGIVARLFDDEVMGPLLSRAEAIIDQHAERRVTLLTPHSDAWPAGLDDLPRAVRPFLLYAFGPLDALRRPIVALFARPPLTDAAFERAQALVRHLTAHDIAPATGAAHGFDVVVHKITAAPPPHPSLLVAPCGMARLPNTMRPTVSAAVRAGGLFLSPFAMDHGPFAHDDKERALVLAALSKASVFVEPVPETPEWHAMTWSLEAGRPVFAVPAADPPLSPGVHRLTGDVDFDWVLAAVGETP